ncbi:BspA family leucine-rich repeat surface protein [Peredibacter sp. HCB2-198]|uniref:BspA family leucine-rich repeat surface protein n=1 Tax=Peredibacter sp. HCB2-198 TaxID=3383025 RepID=UPI0038B547B3
MKVFSFMLLLLLFWGCSGGQGTNTTLSVSRSFSIGAQAGGLMIYITNKTKNTTSAISLQSTTKTITLEHGEYNFKAVGWDGAQVMQGNLLCGETSANLKDPTATVEINILKANCENENFVPAAFRATGGVASLKLTNCQDLTSVNAYTSTCEDSQRGTIGSYRVRLVSYDASTINHNGSLNSPCIAAQAFPNGTTSTGIKLPYGDVDGTFITAVDIFSDSSCTSGKEMIYFPFGMANTATGAVSDIYTDGYYVNLFAQKSSQLLTLSVISMTSSNPNPAYAKIGDTLTLNFTANKAANFTVTINGIQVTPTASGTNYSATYSFNGSEQEGVPVPFFISAEGTSFSSTTDFSQVIFLKTVPTTSIVLVNPVSSPANNPNPVFQVNNVISGNTVYLHSDSACSSAPMAQAPGTAPSTQISPPALSPGLYIFYSRQKDPAGNTSSCSSSVNYEYQNLALSSISMSSSNPNTDVAKAGDTVTISFTSSANSTFTATVNGNSVPVNPPTGLNYTISYVVQPGDADGAINFQINSTGGVYSNVTSGSPVVVDNTAPVYPSLSLISPAENASHQRSITLQLNNLELNGKTEIYQDPGCSTMFTQMPTASASQTYSTPDLTIGQQYQFYVRQWDKAGNASPCSTASVSYRVKYPFQSEWQIAANGETIALPLPPSGFTYNFTVDWGDGTPKTTHTSYAVSHSYQTAGTYTITITGTMEAWSFNNSPNAPKIKKVLNLGEMGWKDFQYGFKGCSNLTIFNGGDVSLVTNMSYMFSQAPLVTPDTSNWNVSNVTNMGSMFEGASAANPNTSTWQTHNVVYMYNMFKDAPMANPDVSGWNTSNVEQMDRMFNNATAAMPDTTNWNTIKVQTMTSMFEGATLANPDTTNWDLGVVTNLNYMFTGSGITKTNWSKFLVMAEATATATSANAEIDTSVYHDSTAVTPKTNLEGTFNWIITDLGYQP